jgi:hypothetical protein
MTELDVQLGAARQTIKEQAIEIGHLRNLLADAHARISDYEKANEILIAGHEANIRYLSEMLHEHTKVGA